jgi:23S rRNA (uracil1939-C5)-methyltransferase
MVRRNRKQQYMIVFITYEDKMKGLVNHSSLTSLFPSIVSIIQNMNHKTTNVILGSLSRVVYGEEYLIDEIEDLQFQISHYSFFQVNSIQTDVCIRPSCALSILLKMTLWWMDIVE